MPTPSLLIVPARFKTGKLYSQIPTSGAGDFTVTRNTAATRLNSAGLLESVASGIPRLDYYTSGGVTGCPALLVEPAATNLALRSEELDNAVWTNALWGNWSNATAASSTTLAPDGSTNAEELTFTTNTSSRLQRITGIAASTTYTFSMYVMGKAGNSYQNGIFLRIATGFNNALVATSAATGRVDSTVSNTAWTRYSVTFTTPSSGVNEFNVGITVANSGTSPNATMICWGAQLETGSVATSYIPTTAGTGSRSADVISVTGAVSGSIGQTEGTIYMEVAVYSTNKELFSISSGGVNGEAIRIQTNSDGKLGAIALVSNSQVITTSSINALNLGQFYKVAFAYKLNDYTLYIDGVVQTLTDVTGGVPVNMNKLVFARPNDSFIQDQRVRALALYNTRLTNAELATLTTP